MKISGSWADGISGLCAEFLRQLVFYCGDAKAVNQERIA